MKDLLDLKNNKIFLLETINGNKENYEYLQQWYDKIAFDTNNPIEEYKRDLFEFIKMAYEQNYIKKNEKQSKSEGDLLNSNKATQKLSSKNEFKKVETIENNNSDVNSKINNMIAKMNEMELTINILSFNDEVKNILIKEYFFYREEQMKLNDFEENRLLSLMNDLYLFKNISIYRKIAYILSSELISKFKKFLYKEGINVKLYPKYYYNDNFKNLRNILDFFNFVYNKTSKFVHWSKESIDLYDSIKNKGNILNNNENTKTTKEFIESLKSKCTCSTLINTLKDDTSYLFFWDNHIYSGIKSLKKNINTQIDKIKNLIKNENDQDFKVELSSLEKNIIEIKNNKNFKNIKDKKLISDFEKNSILIEKNKNNIHNFKTMEKVKLEIQSKINEVLKLKKSITTNYFTFKDFIKLYKVQNKEINRKNKEEFKPYSICRSLLLEELNKNIDFFMDDKKKLYEYLNN